MSGHRPWFVVTGAASGIGLATARALAANDCSLVIVDLDAKRLVEAAQGLAVPSTGASPAVSVSTVVADVGAPAAMSSAIAALPPDAHLAGWVNCAGVNIPGAIADIEPARLREGMRTNFESVFWGCQAAVRHMVEQGAGGSIVNFTSTAAFVGYPGNAVYAAAKGAIVALTKQVAAEYAVNGIRCNAVAPGVIDTPMNSTILDGNPDRERLISYWKQLSPVGRLGTAAEAAAMAVFLLGEHGGFTTGQTFVVDGGQLAIGRSMK
ncbi:MAG: SDR family NAD(P)-dependent oxidoreductase [Nocardioides sp.]